MKHAQHGMALVEALVASAVLGIGLLGATQLTLKALQTATDTRQRHVAQMLAQEAMDCALSNVSNCNGQDSVQVQGTRYTRQLRITPRSANLQDVWVSVQWPSSVPLTEESPGSARQDWHSSMSQVPRWVGVSSP